MKSETKINCTNKSLWCLYSKERIFIGEQYFTITEQYGCETITKHYKEEYREYIDDEEE